MTDARRVLTLMQKRLADSMPRIPKFANGQIRPDDITVMVWIGSVFRSATRDKLFPATGMPLLVRLMQWNERGSCESGFQLVAERNLFCHSFDASVGAIAETVFA